MAKQKPEENPATASAAHEVMIPRLERSMRLLGGTDAMRSAGQEMLPLHNEETSAGWNDRLAQNVLFNSYELTLDELAGKPFSEPIAVQEDVPEAIREHLEDVDLQGNTIDAFAYEWFKDALRGAVSCVLVDFPRVQTEDEDGNPIQRTLADDRAENLRPYWVRVPLENIIFASSERVGGVEVLTHVRIHEFVIEQVGFAEIEIEQIRVLEPGLVQIWRKEHPKRKSSTWIIWDQYETSLDFIPLMDFYTDRDGLMHGRPMLDDLAHLNIRHWQSMSDQIRALTVSRFAMLVGKGMYENEQSHVVVGPEQAMMIPADADLFWLESKGTAIEQGRQDLIDLEDRMGSYGGQFLRKKPGNMTATARALDSAESMSAIQAAAMAFQSALEVVLLFHAAWMGLPEGGSVKVNTDFVGLDESNQAILATLDKAVDAKRISTVHWTEEMKRRNVIMEDYDREDDEIQIEKEHEEAAARMPQIDLDPEGGEDDDDEEPTPDTSGDQTREVQ